MRPDLDRIPFPSGGLSGAANRRTTGRDYAATDSARHWEWYLSVDHDSAPPAVFAAGIAVVDIASDDTTTNYRAENRAEYDANTAAAAHATIVST